MIVTLDRLSLDYTGTRAADHQICQDQESTIRVLDGPVFVSPEKREFVHIFIASRKRLVSVNDSSLSSVAWIKDRQQCDY